MSETSVLTHLTTSWHDPWLVSLLHQQGLRHYKAGEPCQDSYLIQTIGDCLFLGVADGMGSAARSKEGADAALAVTALHLRRTLQTDKPSAALLLDAFSATQKTLKTMAAADTVDIAQFATTLAVALVTKDTLYTANIGDSSILLIVPRLKQGTVELIGSPICSAPQPNSDRTYSIISDDWRTRTTTEAVPVATFQGIILATDGAENFFSDDMGHSGGITYSNTQIAHTAQRISALTPRKLAAVYGTYLGAVDAKNDDDRTLIIAFKPDANDAPPKRTPARAPVPSPDPSP